METKELTDLLIVIGASAGSGAALLEGIKKVRGQKTQRDIILNLNKIADELAERLNKLREENLRLKDELYKCKSK